MKLVPPPNFGDDVYILASFDPLPRERSVNCSDGTPIGGTISTLEFHESGPTRYSSPPEELQLTGITIRCGASDRRGRPSPNLVANRMLLCCYVLCVCVDPRDTHPKTSASNSASRASLRKIDLC